MSPTHRHERLIGIATIRYPYRMVRRQGIARRDGVATTRPVAPRLPLHRFTVPTLIAGTVALDWRGTAAPLMTAGAVRTTRGAGRHAAIEARSEHQSPKKERPIDGGPQPGRQRKRMSACQ